MFAHPVLTRVLSYKHLKEIQDWLKTEINENYQEKPNPWFFNWGSQNYTFIFQIEEDKVKFILRWC